VGAEEQFQMGESVLWCGGSADAAANGSSLDATGSGGDSGIAEHSVSLEGFLDETGVPDIARNESSDGWATPALSPRCPSEPDSSASGDMNMLLSAFEPQDDSVPSQEYDFYDFDLFFEGANPAICGQTPMLHATPQRAPGLVHAA